MNSNLSKITFVGAATSDVDLLKIAAILDADPVDAYFSRIFTFDGQCPNPWSHHDLLQRIKVIGLYLLPPDHEYFGLCSMSDEGDVTLYSETRPIIEKIPGAGVWSEDAEKLGYMNALKQIGDHLYACGDGGQVYIRKGPNQWMHMDEGLLQSPDVTERLMLSAINGAHENAIYTLGALGCSGYPPRCYFWNGVQWRQLQLPESAERLTNIYVESEQRIWMCGANGTLLLGNAQDGFRNLSGVEDNQLFLSLCKFQEKIYLGSNLGLFVYDPADHAAGIRKVITDLTPDLQDANIVDSVDDILWSIGPKDIARFDGEHWERIHHPDNPPIGGVMP